jgi:phosphoribosyl 1,2-cyclic phosphodiesterase
MKLTFLGTRGEIDTRTRRHRMHTSLLVSYRRANVMIDCGLDWLGKLKRVGPNAIVLTHAHPDHAWGLKQGAPCPVYAPEKTWQELKHYPIKDRHVIKERTPTKICGITFEAFPVEHSILSPAVGYRVSAGRACMFYTPDLIFIYEAQCRAKGRPTLHRRRRNGYAVVYSQTRQSVNRSLACSDTTDLVPEGRRTARDHHALGI